MHLTTTFFRNTVLLLLFTVFLHSAANAQCPQRYRDSVFPKVNFRLDNKYGINKLNTDGTRTWQAFNLYEPKDDTVQLRPLIVLIHGGGFTNWPPLDRNSPEIVEMAKNLARRGYVVISPEYRLFSGEVTYDKMAETVIASCLDINELMCYLENSVANGNPYRLDTSRVFMGGSSAGALISLNMGYFVNDTNLLQPLLRQSMNKVAALDGITNVQALLQNKFCGIKLKGILPISGAIIDTNFIQPGDGNVLIIHGKLDGIIPYNQGFAMGNPFLPAVCGPGVFMDRLIRAGFHVEADIYPDKYHVPVLHPYGDDLPLALQLLLQTGSIFDIPVLDSTERHMASFCYNIMGRPVTDCRITGIKQNVSVEKLNIFPNPSNGLYTIEIPQMLRNKKMEVTVYDLSGKVVYNASYYNIDYLPLNISTEAKGIYWLILRIKEQTEDVVYMNKLVSQ